jgi:sugar lactone lactonase YvrE
VPETDSAAANIDALAATHESFELGEGPVWDPLRGRLLWVDIAAGTVYEGELDPGSGAVTVTRGLSFDATVGAVAAAADGTLLVAEKSVLTRVDTSGERTRIARVFDAGLASRLNDGAVDPAGRFLVGSLALDGRRGEEVLVRLEDDGCRPIDRDLTLSNGLAWSPDGSRFYSIDTVPGTVWTRAYDPATGRIGTRSALIHFTDGSPDGMCVDAEGNLWIAVWGRGRVECRTPKGELRCVVNVAAPHTSSVAFAGPGLDVLVITTATQDLTEARREAFPRSGCLFTARVGVRGLPGTYWLGE